MPHPSKLRTSLHFNPDELQALKGTNLYAATIDRRAGFQADWAQCQSAVQSVDATLASAFTWENYLTASTYLASRAFPSSILSPNPTLIASPSSYPVLLPGIDSLNHARGQPVTWLVSYPDDPVTRSDKDATISLVLHVDAEPGQELFNNYGPKPNSELILAYGFTIANNAEDTIVLQVGGHGQENKRWEVGRNARGFDAVWEEVHAIIASQSEAELSYEDDLETADMLDDMFNTLCQRLPKPTFTGEIRSEVQTMLHHYIEGQADILRATIEYTERKRQQAIADARDQGIELVFDDEEE